MKNVRKIIHSNKGLIAFVFFYALARTAYADWSNVPSGSMEPTIYPGDYLLINKTAYGPSIPFLNIKLVSWGSPDRGDIITFVPPHTSDLYVKRVVGLPGDRVVVDNEKVFINGAPVSQNLNYMDRKIRILNETLANKNHGIQFSLNLPTNFSRQDFVVPEGKYFVMGDHRNNSVDSRSWGFVDENKITGKVNRLAVSFAEQRGFWDSIGQAIN